MKAIDRVYTEKNNVLFKKKGNKYLPANDPWAYSGLREGWWLVKVESGSTSIRSIVYPAQAELLAAAKKLEAERDLAKKRSPWIGYASTAYQLAIVLLSASILAVSMGLFWGSFVVAGVGVVLSLQGLFLVF